MTCSATVVIGANYGDEGKGLMTDYFAAQTPGSVVVRFNGGCQAGHTVTTPEGQRHVFSHVGSGTFVGAATYLSQHFAVNPLLYRKERALLEKLLTATPTLYVDYRAPVTTPFDMLLNQMVEAYRGQDRHGSCGMGFGETIGRHESRYKLTMADLLDSTELADRLRTIRGHYVPERCAALGVPWTFVQQEFGELLSSDALIQGFIAATQDFLADIQLVPDARFLSQMPAVVMEGAQGLLLDQTRGAFPHVTRSNTGLQNACQVAAESGLSSLSATYVTRAYLTRHGAGPLANELPQQPYAAIEDQTNRPNPYQGALRFAHLDHNLLAQSIETDLLDASQYEVACEATLAVSCLDQVTPGAAAYWKDGVLERSSTVDAQLQDLDNRVPLGFCSWGPTRDTISRA